MDANTDFGVPLLLIYGVFDAIFVLNVCGISFDAFRGVSGTFSRVFYRLFGLVLLARFFVLFLYNFNSCIF